MNTKRHRFLINLNRALIFVLTLLGLLMDGIQLADVPCSIALLVWLWLPLCTRMEEKLMRWVGSKGGHIESANVTPLV